MLSEMEYPHWMMVAGARVLAGIAAADADQTWSSFNTRMPNGRTAIEEMIQSCLMRPRFLIDLCESALSFAIKHAVFGPGSFVGVGTHSRRLLRGPEG